MKFLFIPLLLVAFLPVEAEQPPEPAKRTCRILFPSKPTDALKEAYLFDGTNSQKVDFPSMNFSEVIELPVGELTLGFFRKARNTLDGLPKEAQTIKLPENVTDFLLLVKSEPDNQPLPISFTLIDVSNNRLKSGETLWINYTPHNISAQWGERSLSIPAMKRAICRPILEESGYYKAQFTYQRKAEGDFLPIMRKSWWFDAGSKNLGFIVETDARLPKIFTIRDHRN